MPGGAPFNLALAVVIALFGTAYGAFLLTRTVRGLRYRKQLHAELPSLDHFDIDIRRYLTRCYTLYATWRESLHTTELDASWAAIIEGAEALQAERAKEDSRSAEMISGMVARERALESRIADLRR